MKSLLRSGGALAACVVFSGLLSSVAAARTIPATAGRTANGANATCYIWDSLAVGPGGAQLGLRNNCAGVVSAWTFGLTIDSPVAHTVIVRVKETGAGSVACHTTTVNPNGSSVGNFGAISAPVAGWQDLIMGTPAVPAGGTVYVTCAISGPNTAKILSVDWF
ncbi:MAG TPA: hypothetical protein VFZ61_05290 [Polyangiales bacterium]